MGKAKIVAVLGSACLLGATVGSAYAESYQQSDAQSSNAYVAQAPASYYQPAPTVYRAPAKAATTDSAAGADTSTTSTSYLLGHEREY